MVLLAKIKRGGSCVFTETSACEATSAIKSRLNIIELISKVSLPLGLCWVAIQVALPSRCTSVLLII